MKLPLKIHLLTITMAACFVPTANAKTKKQPVFVDPAFRFEDVDTIYILPAVDLTVNKDKNPEKRLEEVDWAAPRFLKKRGYRTVPDEVKAKPPSPPARMNLTEDDLKEPEVSWIRKLGTDDAHWVLVLALEDASSHMTFGSTGKAIVMATLFDRHNGKLVWRAVGAGGAGQGGLLGMAMKSAMTDAAIGDAVMEICDLMPKQRKRK